jgi:hypothetical protein
MRREVGTYEKKAEGTESQKDRRLRKEDVYEEREGDRRVTEEESMRIKIKIRDNAGLKERS